MNAAPPKPPSAEPKPRYEPPTIEDVPIAPEERLLVACKAAGEFNPACLGACESCSSPGS